MSAVAYQKLYPCPVTVQQANDFVKAHHRHHKPCPGHKFSIGIQTESGVLCGVAIVGRPVARLLDNGSTLEVNRCCTDGVRNGCSLLYGMARRIAKEMGYLKLITYTLPEEGGASLRASGWKHCGSAGGGTWNRDKRARADDHPLQVKHKWEAELALPLPVARYLDPDLI